MLHIPALQALEEQVHQGPLFKQQLLDYIERSKTDKKWRTTAASAITILVRAGVQFNGADLRGIQIPKADLSHGLFDSAQLEGANLRGVNLRCSWMRQANLSKAQMSDVRFGELPFLTPKVPVRLSVYSPDGTTMAIGLESGKVYSISTWEKLWTLDSHLNAIPSFVCGISYSPDGNHIASSSADNTVRLLSVETTECLYVLAGHDDLVRVVVYSPRVDTVASASSDLSVRLWSVVSGDCLHVLREHHLAVFHVVFSPNGDQVATGSTDRSVRLWDVETGTCLHTLLGHSETINSIVYSPQGDVVASGSQDKTVRLWDPKTGVCRQTLIGHSGSVTSAVFSPTGHQIASSDMTVRLWDVGAGLSSHSHLGGHSSAVWSIVFSPNGKEVATCSDDATVRIWDVETGECRTLRGHKRRWFSPRIHHKETKLPQAAMIPQCDCGM